MPTDSAHWGAQSAVITFHEADSSHETFIITAYVEDGDRLTIVLDGSRDRTARLAAQAEVWVRLHDPHRDGPDETFVAAIETVEPASEALIARIRERYRSGEEPGEHRSEARARIAITMTRTQLQTTYPTVTRPRTMDTRNGLEMLSAEQCRSYLEQRAGGIGRLAVGGGSLVDVFPVNYQLDRSSIVLRTDPGTKLAMAAGSIVAFEVDDHDYENRTGWSVVARGTAEIVDEPKSLERLDDLGLESWRTPEPTVWIRIDPWKLTGRRIGLADRTGIGHATSAG